MRHPDPQRHQLLTLSHAGQRWTGDWRLSDDGRAVEVRSAYGSESRPLGRRKPERVAEEVLAGLVESWRARRAR